MKIWYAPYQLHSRQRLNHLHENLNREGFLLRIEFASDLVGFADCFPWHELGDPPISAHLKTLKDGGVTELLSRAFCHARLDAQARAAGQSLFEGLMIPPSHYLATHLNSGELLSLGERGFDRIKIKVGKDWHKEAEWLKEIVPQLPKGTFLRLDFNFGYSTQQALALIETLGAERMRAFEFWEDPVEYSPGIWAQLSEAVPLAADRCVFDPTVQDKPFRFRVVKPALENPESWLPWAKEEKGRLVVTSYMDHPVGQTFAAYWAAKLNSLGATLVHCGLKTDHCYDTNEFSERISSNQNFFPVPEGPGIGFGDLLERQVWQSI